jgi:superfamily I DNA/RNA helicase
MEPLIVRFITAFAVILARLGFAPSAQQLAIFAWFAYGSGNLVVRARAGTGKTSTIMAALNFVRERNVLVAAFSKDIADELSARVKDVSIDGRKIEARSLHSLGNGLCWYYLGGKQTGTQIDSSRGRRLARLAVEQSRTPADVKLGIKPVESQIITLVNKLASLGKNMSPFAKAVDLLALAKRFDLTVDPAFEKAGWRIEDIAACALQAMTLATQKETNAQREVVYDYDDQIFLPVRMGWARPKYDLVIIDEAQDMNATQILLAQRVCRGRLVIVGDDCQAIYGFRGADSASIDRLKTELDATELPLTTTYRCGTKIVALAQEFVPDYQAAPNAHAGEVLSAHRWEYIYDNASGGDFVLSRNNAQITKICLKLLRKGKPAFIRGRNIGDALKEIIAKIAATTIPGLILGLQAWSERQIEVMIAKLGPDEELDERAVEKVNDEADTITALAEDLNTVADLNKLIDSLFSDNRGGAATVCCSTIHRAKGLEANRVFLLVDTLRYGEPEERNIAYVGITRAKNTLVRVHGK